MPEKMSDKAQESGKEIKGTIHSVIFRNEENGYMVFTVATENDIQDVTCVGYAASRPSIGDEVAVTGAFSFHPIYGKQFNCDLITIATPTTLAGIEKYIGSGFIKGIGKRLAKRVINEFGTDTFNVFESAPEKLARVKGITLEVALAAGEQFRQREEERRAVMFLVEFGVSPAFAVKIYTRYKEKTVATVKANPYRLADDISGIGFLTADQIARRAGFSEDSAFRVKCGIRYTLYDALSAGHVYLPRPHLIARSRELLGVSEELIDSCLYEMQADREIRVEDICGVNAYYLKSSYYSESRSAKRLLEILLNESSWPNANESISSFEHESGITLAEEQRKAVALALTSGVAVITGGPGTGKTTIIKAIIHLLSSIGQVVELAAPTGRAAKRMSEATGCPAKTLHRLLGIFAGQESDFDEKREVAEVDADVIIVDEASMVDIALFYSLVQAIGPGTRLILVGDADQLPSVGAGDVLKNIIASRVIPVVRLEWIYRQAAESAIVRNAHRVNRGEYPEFEKESKDFFFMKRHGANAVIETLIDLTTQRLPKYVKGDALRDIQVLSPMRKGPLGVINLNILLQEALNPSRLGVPERRVGNFTFRQGDKVMQIRNNYKIAWHMLNSVGDIEDEGMGVYNGDCGIITSVDEEAQVLTVAFDDGKCVRYAFSALDELEPAYAMTIHKAQGCEVRAVVMPIYSGSPMLMTRNLLYTAITRAKHLCVLVGDIECMRYMVDNDRETVRFSALDYRLKKLKPQILI